MSRPCCCAVLTVGLALLACTVAPASGYYSTTTRHTTMGSWTQYTRAEGPTFWLGWASDGADRCQWYTAEAGVARDMHLHFRHSFKTRANGDTSADHWSWAEGVAQGVAISQRTPAGSSDAVVQAVVNERTCYNWNDALEVGSDGGGAMDTIAEEAQFLPCLDAVYAGKSVESSMYLGNVYWWMYSMTNPALVHWNWTASTTFFTHTAGVMDGPGWYNSTQVGTGGDTLPGGTLSWGFNIRPRYAGSSEEHFQMEYGANNWFGDKAATNPNMATAVSVTRKAPGATDGWHNGARKKGETVRLSVAGADSWGAGSAYSWDWDAATTQGWHTANVCTVTQEDSNDRLRIDVTGADPYCHSSSGLAIDAATCRYMTIRMASTGGSTAQLFWSGSAGGYSGDRHVDWGIIPDGMWHVYRVALPASWSGTIYQLRLDPVGEGAASGQVVYVDWLRIHNVNEGLSGVIWLATTQSSWNLLSAQTMAWDSGAGAWYYDCTLANGYPQTYYACLRMKNDNNQESDNHDRRFGGSGGGWGYRSYKVLNTPPTAANTSLAGNPWTADNTPTLAWSYADADPNAQSNYRVQVDDDPAFGSPAVDTNYVAGTAASYTPGTGLADGQWYYRVGVLDGVSQSARNGTYAGGVTLNQSGGVTGNTSASFDGTDDHVALPAFNDSFGSGMTIEFWARPTASRNYARFLDLGNGAPSDNILLYRADTSNNLNFGVFDGANSSNVTAVGAIINNEWHHYAVVLNSDRTVNVYRDGTALAVSGRLYMPNPVNRTLNYIGRSNWASDAYYAGGLDEFAIYDRSLTQTDIQAHYNARASAETYRQLVLAHSPWAYYRFGESSGTTAANLNGGQGWSSGTGFKVDATKPVNPGASCSDGKASGEWRSTSAPTFTLSGATDSGSGLKTTATQRYKYYWGTSSAGTPATLDDESVQPGTLSADGTYYLRVQTQDNAGNWSDAATVFTYKYDGTKPVNPSAVCSDGKASGDWRNTSAPTFTLSGASDTGSGLKTTVAERYRYYWGTTSTGTPATLDDESVQPGTLTAEGTYYLRVQTQDNAGNWSDAATVFTYKYDATKPVNPTAATCGDGKASGVWRNTSAPTFTLSGASDSTSGLKTTATQRYRYYLGTSSSGTPATLDDETVQPASLTTEGKYYLRVQTQDNAGNWSDTVTLFEYWYDGTKPVNPTAACSDGKATGEWRNTSAPTFTLSGASDGAGSGLKTTAAERYRYYWGTSDTGTPSAQDDEQVVPGALSADGTYYLRVQTLDNAGNWSDAATLFTYKYDATPPAAAPAVSTTSNASGIIVNFTAGSDSGANQSGLASAAYRVTRAAFGGFDSGPLASTAPAVDTEALTELAEGDVAAYTIKTCDAAGNESTSTVTGRKRLAGTAWIYSTGASSMAAPGLIPNAGSPATTGVFAGSNDYRLHGMDPGAGGMLFGPVDTGALVQGTVLDRTAPIKDYAAYGLANPMVFASSLDGNVYARKFAASAWSEAWTRQAVTAGYPVKVKPAGQLQVPLTAGPRSGQTRNLVVAGTYANNLSNSFVAMDMEDGVVLWTTTPGNLAYVTGSPVISGTTAYFTSYSASGSPSVWAVNLTNGAVLWSRSGVGDISAAPAISGDGSVLYVGNNAGTMYAFSTANGTSPALWTSALADGPVYGAPWPFGGTLFVSTRTRVHKLSAATGASDGTGWPVPVSRPSIPVVGASGKLYVGASGGNIYQIDIYTGAAIAKSLGVAAGTIGDPVLGTDAPEMYVGAADGRIYKIALPFE